MYVIPIHSLSVFIFVVKLNSFTRDALIFFLHISVKFMCNQITSKSELNCYMSRNSWACTINDAQCRFCTNIIFIILTSVHADTVYSFKLTRVRHVHWAGTEDASEVLMCLIQLGKSHITMTENHCWAPKTKIVASKCGVPSPHPIMYTGRLTLTFSFKNKENILKIGGNV